VGIWDALSGTMQTVLRRRIGRREAEQLLGRGRTGSEHAELSFLLAAAAAPPRPDELVGLPSAMAAFERAGDLDRPMARQIRRSLLARSVAVKALAGAAALLVGGTAVAAETGSLPGGAQQQAHDLFSSLGVPAPGAGADPPGATPTLAEPSPTPSPSGVGRTLSPSSPAVLGLCRAWAANQTNKGKAMAAEALQDLAAAAGGAERIGALCAPLLANDRGPATSTPTRDPGAAPPAPSNPGKGHGRPTFTPHQKG
jgi:hypothetical protein